MIENCFLCGWTTEKYICCLCPYPYYGDYRHNFISPCFCIKNKEQYDIMLLAPIGIFCSNNKGNCTILSIFGCFYDEEVEKLRKNPPPSQKMEIEGVVKSLN